MNWSRIDLCALHSGRIRVVQSAELRGSNESTRAAGSLGLDVVGAFQVLCGLDVLLKQSVVLRLRVAVAIGEFLAHRPNLGGDSLDRDQHRATLDFGHGVVTLFVTQTLANSTWRATAARAMLLR